MEKRYILEAHGSGAGFFDSDNDGDLDLYLVNGATFETWEERSGPGNSLYRNNGDGTFSDVAAAAGVDDAGWGAGCAVGDIDNDGDRDLYVTNYRANLLYGNRGDGAFADLTADAGVAGDDYSAGAAFFDYDNDGDLDLYVANYLRFDLRDNPRVDCDYVGGIKTYCGPLGMEGAADVLYRNDGGGGFADVTASSGVGASAIHFGLGVLPGDFDGDGLVDLYVANDQTPNLLFRNRGDGTFGETGLVSGVAYSGDGDEEAGMGVDSGDFDGDGDPDLYVTNFFRESNTLYRNEGAGRFSDFTVQADLEAVTLTMLGWGTAFSDLDNDGDLDLFVANGHVFPEVDDAPTGTSYRQLNQVFRNDGDGGSPTSAPRPDPGWRSTRSAAAPASATTTTTGASTCWWSTSTTLPPCCATTGRRGTASWSRSRARSPTATAPAPRSGCGQGAAPGCGSSTAPEATCRPATSAPISGSAPWRRSSRSPSGGRTAASRRSGRCPPTGCCSSARGRRR